MALSRDQLRLIHEMCDLSDIIAVPHYQDYVTQLPLDIDQKQFNFDHVIAEFKAHPNVLQQTLESINYHRNDSDKRLAEAKEKVAKQNSAADNKKSETSAERDVKKYQKLSEGYTKLNTAWFSLNQCVQENKPITAELQREFQQVHPNFHPVSVAYMAQYEAKLRREIPDEKIRTHLIRLREACLGMSPIQDYQYAEGGVVLHFRLGEFPLSLDRLHEQSTPEEVRDEVRRRISTAIDLLNSMKSYFHLSLAPAAEGQSQQEGRPQVAVDAKRIEGQPLLVAVEMPPLPPQLADAQRMNREEEVKQNVNAGAAPYARFFQAAANICKCCTRRGCLCSGSVASGVGFIFGYVLSCPSGGATTLPFLIACCSSTAGTACLQAAFFLLTGTPCLIAAPSVDPVKNYLNRANNEGNDRAPAAREMRR